MEKSSKFIVILSTTNQRESAYRIAEALIQQQLAACVQVDGPIKSFYRWEGKIENSDEFRIVIKTTREMENRVFELIREIHDYDTPQIISIPVVGGLKEYLSWVDAETRNEG